MAKVHGKSSVILIGGYDLSTYFKELNISHSKDTADVTCFGATARSFIEGVRTGQVELSGFFDGVVGGIDVRFATIFSATSATLATVSPQAQAIGAAAWLLESWDTDYRLGAPVDGAVAASATLGSGAGTTARAIERGVWLTDGTEKTVDAGYTSVDNGAASSNGGVVIAQVLAFSGYDSADLVIQESSDNGVDPWAAQITISSIAANTAYIGTTTNAAVERYIRLYVDVTGAGPGSVLAAVAFARR